MNVDSNVEINRFIKRAITKIESGELIRSPDGTLEYECLPKMFLEVLTYVVIDHPIEIKAKTFIDYLSNILTHDLKSKLTNPDKYPGLRVTAKNVNGGYFIYLRADPI